VLEVKDFLIELCESAHVSGFESEGAEIVRRAFAEQLPDVSIDKFGNVVGVKKGRGKGKLMLAAHLDEIGLMAADIDERGFVRFTTIGGFDARVFPALEVTIHGREKVFGVIGVLPPHILPPEDRSKAFKAEDLFVDTGYSRERLQELIGVGDIITINNKAVTLKNDLLSAKSMDDSAGIAALYAAMKKLQRTDHDLTVYFVATAQEEVGIRGATTSAYSLEPDIAIAVDVGFGKTPDMDESKALEMGGGPGIAVGPGIHPAVYETLKKCAKAAGVKCQTEVIPSRTGTDADSLQISRHGVATGVVSIPLRYMHTPVETVNLNDIDSTGRLLAEFVKAFDDTDLEVALCL